MLEKTMVFQLELCALNIVKAMRGGYFQKYVESLLCLMSWPRAGALGGG